AKVVARRLQTVRRSETDRQALIVNRERAADIARRRRSVQDALKELETRQHDVDMRRKPPLKLLLRQAGLKITPRRFHVLSLVGAILGTVILYLAGTPLLALAGMFVVLLLGLPRWLILHLRKRRVKAFLDELPNALEAVIRAVRSGLPINDGIRLVAAEAREPARSEFRQIVEAQQLGLSLPEAALRMQDSMPCPEASFFGIVIQIQQQAGGNLSEALGNLARVLRERKKMKARISALSMEARASATIIGSLPIMVGMMLFFVSHDYIMPLFTTDTGKLLLGVCAGMMGAGIFVMRQMMNFEI